jgi:uncharacterized protein (TIGR02594 family)
MRAPWLGVAKIEMAKGVHEIPGNSDNPRIVEYLTTVGLPHEHDETPWCSAFVNWCLDKVGVLGTRRANARSFLSWGSELELPTVGCVVAFSRPPDPSHGHVAFYLGQDTLNIHVLGGNQGNSVSVASYPKSRWLAYRWPSAGA